LVQLSHDNAYFYLIYYYYLKKKKSTFKLLSKEDKKKKKKKKKGKQKKQEDKKKVHIKPSFSFEDNDGYQAVFQLNHIFFFYFMCVVAFWTVHLNQRLKLKLMDGIDILWWVLYEEIDEQGKNVKIKGKLY